jgi:hypothetical protein
MEELATRMSRLFEGYAGAHGTYSAEDRNEAKGGKLEIKRTARTLREPVTLDLWLRHLKGKRPLGIITIREDDACLWGCVDVDKYDVVHAEVVAAVERAGLPLVVCRTKSGGAHIFLFLEKPAPAAEVSAALRDVAAALGHGGSEIFPKQSKILTDRGDLGSWLNMPYYGGDESVRVGVKRTGLAMTLPEFLDAAEKARTTIDKFARLVEKGRPRRKPKRADQPDANDLSDGPPCLEILTATPMTDGRKRTLFSLAIYCKKKYGSDWQARLEELNREVMSPPLPHQEVAAVVRSVEKKEYQYPCKDEPICSHCNAVACRARKYGVSWSENVPMISGLAMLESDPPIWFVDVEGERLEVTTSDLQNFKLFHKLCMERMICYTMLKQDTWLAIVAEAMKDAQRIGVPPEVGTKGQFEEHLEDFCTNRHRGERREDILSGKPWEDEERGRHYFRLRDLQGHLERAGFKSYTRGQITARLRGMGGDHDFFNLDGKGTNVWWVPRGVVEVAPPARPKQAPKEAI